MKKIRLAATLVDVTKFDYRKFFPKSRHTAEGRCPGIATAMTCPAGDFSSPCDEKQNVCDAGFCVRKNWTPREITHKNVAHFCGARYRGVTAPWNNFI